MLNLAKAERKAARFANNLDLDDVYEQLDTLRGYVQELTQGVGKSASKQFGRARDFASDTAHDAEDTMKDNLAASLVIASGLGVVVGYFLRRGTE